MAKGTAGGGGGIEVVKPGGAFIRLPGGARIPITAPGGGFRITGRRAPAARRPAGAGGGVMGTIRGVGQAIRARLNRIIGRRG
jgi:hypothetical protein